MIDSIYIGLSGLTTNSRGLQTVSNNVTNLNTPGFKTSTLRFADLFYTGGGSGSMEIPGSPQFGSGVTYTQTTINFKQGEIRTSSQDLDVAIEGRGFLALLNGDETVYTRTGQFAIDADGNLSETNVNRKLAILTPAGVLQAFNVNDRRVSPPSATKEVKFVDNLSSTDDEHVISDVEVFDTNGGSHKWTIRFKNDFAATAGRWAVSVEDEDGTKIAESEIVFNGSVPVPGKDKISVDLKPASGAASTVLLDFSSGVTGFSSGTSSSLRIQSKDGFGLGELTRISIDDEGRLKLEYSNGQTEATDHIALVDFEDLQALRQRGDGLFEDTSVREPRIGRQGEFGLGTVLGQSIEASNVDLSQEFGQLILYQRGYQASSQVISVANEMIQQLFDLRGGS
jgi:flagellar hook protein FlgE